MDNLEKLIETLNIQPNSNNIEQIDNMIRTLPFMNDNIRENIILGMEIYKKLINLDRIYIHNIVNEKSINSK